MSDCIFCKIANGDIPTDFLYEDDDVVAFKDLSPQAPFHALVIPKKHISILNDIEEADLNTIGKMSFVASKIAKNAGIADEGFRTVMNCNEHGGQTVYHIHMHVLGGRQMSWPPG